MYTILYIIQVVSHDVYITIFIYYSTYRYCVFALGPTTTGAYVYQRKRALYTV